MAKKMLLKSGESHLSAEDMATEIARIYNEEAREPFPYEGCRWLKIEFDVFEDLIPDLDMWLMNIAGCSSYGKRIVSLPVEKILEARGMMSLSFFDTHPEYAVLERHISEENTPDLYEKLYLYEKMRGKLLKLFDHLLVEQYKEEVS